MRPLLPCLALALAASTPPVTAEAQPIRVFVTRVKAPAPPRPTDADRQAASVAYDEADKARKALEKALKAQHGTKRDKAGRRQERLADAEDAQLIMTLRGVRNPMAVVNAADDRCLLFLVGKGPQVSVEPFAQIPRTHRPGRAKAKRLEGTARRFAVLAVRSLRPAPVLPGTGSGREHRRRLRWRARRRVDGLRRSVTEVTG